jgi:hypothetical protein
MRQRTIRIISAAVLIIAAACITVLLLRVTMVDGTVVTRIDVNVRTAGGKPASGCIVELVYREEPWSTEHGRESVLDTTTTDSKGRATFECELRFSAQDSAIFGRRVRLDSIWYCIRARGPANGWSYAPLGEGPIDMKLRPREQPRITVELELGSVGDK